MKALKIINIQFFDNSHNGFYNNGDVILVKRYSANIALESEGREFMIQLSGDEDGYYTSFPYSDEASYNGEESQDWAKENFELDELVAFVESEGVENNFYWLDENADEHY